MKKSTRPLWVVPALLALTVVFNVAVSFAQVPSASSLRNTPTEIDKDAALVNQVIQGAEAHFNQGSLNLQDNKREQAREEFDKAIDTIIESGFDVRANHGLQTYYLELIERIYRLEVPPTSQRVQVAVAGSSDHEEQQIGFRDQKFEPSPLDELAKLQLTDAEKNVRAGDIDALEVAKNTVDFGFNINPLIQQFINYYQGRGRITMEMGLRRSGQFMAMARRIFREEGVPEDLAWLGQVESAWRVRAFSSASASGLWQFIPSTGVRFGLRQTAWVDERNSYEKATRASAKYLRWLANRYNGNWELAMAAYNTGEGNIDRAISRAGSSNFWQIYPYIAQETRNYVPNILATIFIAKNPEKFGFNNVRRDSPLSWDTVEVTTATSLHVVAEGTGVSLDYIRMLNPELRRDVTPRGESHRLRVPSGKSTQFVAFLKEIPIDRRDRGASNTVIPVVMTRERASSRGASARELTTMYARPGDTIAKIAQRVNASADEIARLNGIPVGAQLQPGQQLKVPSAARNAPATRRRR